MFTIYAKFHVGRSNRTGFYAQQCENLRFLSKLYCDNNLFCRYYLHNNNIFNLKLFLRHVIKYIPSNYIETHLSIKIFD